MRTGFSNQTTKRENSSLNLEIVRALSMRKKLQRSLKHVSNRFEGYRTGFDIIYEILMVISMSHTPLVPTRVMTYTGLSYQQAKNFIAGILIPGEFIDLEEGHLKILPKGFEYMETFKKLREIMGLESEGTVTQENEIGDK